MPITKKQIEELLEYKSNEMPVTSFYLNVDPKKFVKEGYIKNYKTLMRNIKEKLSKDDISRDGYYSVTKDFDKIENYIKSVKDHSFKGVVLFSSSKNNFYQVYEIDNPVRNKIIVDFVPYTKPLYSIIGLMKRYLSLLFKKDKLRVFEVYGNKIKEELDLFRMSCFDSRFNAYIFINEKKYYNRKETEYYKFLRDASSEVLDLFIRKGADYITLGGDNNVAKDFYNNMHSYLRDRFAGFINVNFDSKKSEVLNEVKNVNTEIVKKLDKEITDKIISEFSKNGSVAKGINDVLRALTMSAVSILAIEEGYEVPGYMDKESGHLVLNPENYGEDKDKLVKVDDIVYEAIEVAIHQGAEIRMIREKALMADLDHIAALLRFKLPD